MKIIARVSAVVSRSFHLQPSSEKSEKSVVPKKCLYFSKTRLKMQN
jgi:hypothetical protein